jgi:hypothetical protein
MSKDFDVALRLQVNGYIVRLAAWARDGFKGSVSLIVYDGLTRWERYTYGYNELLFKPLLCNSCFYQLLHLGLRATFGS